MKLIEPSLLAFNLNELDAQLQEMKNLGVTYIHYDVMDGIFVANKAFGPEQLLLIQKYGMSSNVHMMVEDPNEWINNFINFPMNACTFHPEVMSFEKCREAFQVLRDKNIKCGIAIKPHVDVNEYVDLLKESDYVCIMSVEPGKGGQSFMPRSIDNMKKVKRIKDELNPRLVIQLDGGVNFEVMKETKQYVDHYVIGSFLMEQINKRAVFDFLKSL